MGNLYFPNLPPEQQEETLEALTYFLENMDTKYLKPKYPHKKNSEQFDREEYNAHGQMLAEMERTEAIVS